jgi:hypothetical protein
VTPNATAFVIDARAFMFEVEINIRKSLFYDHCDVTEKMYLDKLAQYICQMDQNLKAENYMLKMQQN